MRKEQTMSEQPHDTEPVTIVLATRNQGKVRELAEPLRAFGLRVVGLDALSLIHILPKGSLEDPTIDLFDRAGWKVRKHPRNYFPDINDPEITARLCRVQEIPLYIQDGVLDLGLTGKDWVKETKADVVVVSDLSLIHI